VTINKTQRPPRALDYLIVPERDDLLKVKGWLGGLGVSKEGTQDDASEQLEYSVKGTYEDVVRLSYVTRL
jgi:hypothetical protein